MKISKAFLACFGITLAIRMIIAYSVMIITEEPYVCISDIVSNIRVADYGYQGAPLGDCRAFPLLPIFMWLFGFIGISPYYVQFWGALITYSLGNAFFFLLLKRKQVPYAVWIALFLTCQPYVHLGVELGDPITLAFGLFWAAYYCHETQHYAISSMLTILCTLSHAMGMFLGFAMLIRILFPREEGKWLNRKYLTYLSAPISIALVALYLYLVRGDPFLFVTAQKAFFFGETEILPFWQLWRLSSTPLHANLILDLVVIFLTPFFLYRFYKQKMDLGLWFGILAIYLLSVCLVSSQLSEYMGPVICLFAVEIYGILVSFLQKRNLPKQRIDQLIATVTILLVIAGILLSIRALVITTQEFIISVANMGVTLIII